jgi:hypothetical protein
MSAEPLPPEPKELYGHTNLLVWLATGGVGVAILFAASVHTPQEWKRLGLYSVALGALAGWGLGQWALLRKIRPSFVVIGLTWTLILAGEALAAVQTHRAALKPERAELKPEQIERDMMTEGMREYFTREPEGLTTEERERWLKDRAEFERGEERLRDELEARRVHRSFYGYLANRIPKEWGKWSYPWPAVFWGGEVLLASTLGAWLAAWTLRAGSPRRSM